MGTSTLHQSGRRDGVGCEGLSETQKKTIGMDNIQKELDSLGTEILSANNRKVSMTH